MNSRQIEIFLSQNSRHVLIVVTIVSFVIAAVLLTASWNIEFWPTDAEVYYLPAARELPNLTYLSEIHNSLDEEHIKWLHGKEILVLAISLFQKLLNDTETLRPLMVIGVLSVFLSSVLIFLLARRLWGQTIAVVLWFLFASSFWPYLYILFAKHQTLGLAFFLASVFFILESKPRWNAAAMIAAGMSLAASVYSSTVSALYVPYVGAALGYAAYQRQQGGWLRTLIRDGILWAAGFGAVLLWVNYPNIVYNLKSYLQYVHISGAFNHFYYNQSILVQWIPSFDLKATRGGWIWIIRYFFLIMPLVFPFYLLAVLFLLKRGWKSPKILGLIALSFSTPILAELKGVAQYGANYFTVFVGILLLIGVALSIFLRDPRRAGIFFWGILLVQLLVNAWILITDVYPARMVTTRLSQRIEKLNVRRLATYPTHPLRPNLVDHLNKKVLAAIQWTPIESIAEVKDGYIVVPPVSTDAIYLASTSDYTDFDRDPFLTELVRQGRMKDYAVASLPTLSSSLIWAQEEEILAYRTLVLQQFPPKDKTKVWILDGAAIARDRDRLVPPKEELVLMANHIENIGSAAKVRIFKGHRLDNDAPIVLKGIATRMYKVGNPRDSLRAYIYTVEATQPMWVPNSPGFASRPVSAQDITNDPQGGLVEFVFEQPEALQPGRHLMVIYRTGRAEPQDFYRIYKDFVGRVQ